MKRNATASPLSGQTAQNCKARYAVLFQIWTFSSKPEDEAHIGPTATYDEVIYPGFQHDITALHIQGSTFHTIDIQVPEYITSAEDACLSTNYKQMPIGKGKTHHAHVHAGPGSPPGTPSLSSSSLRESDQKKDRRAPLKSMVA